MTTGYQINDQNGLYFLTFQVVNWIDLFARQVYCDIVIESFKYAITNKDLQLFGYVVMSNHIHLIVRSRKGELSNTLRDIKRHTCKIILENVQSEKESRSLWMLDLFRSNANKHSRNKCYQVWTHENHAVYLHSQKFIVQKLNYTHQNPVRAGIVTKAEDYLYSSARNYAGMESLLEVELLV